ncbi:hypothetical protein N9A76_03755, partial [Mariniblastus sp.]|nr:hypothetical protein [Mariniblastus sp.]
LGQRTSPSPNATGLQQHLTSLGIKYSSSNCPDHTADVESINQTKKQPQINLAAVFIYLI